MPLHRTQPDSIAVAELEIEPAVDERAAAAIIGYTQSALRLWRREGRGPSYIRVGRSIRYTPPDLRAWQQSHRVVPTGERAIATAGSR